MSVREKVRSHDERNGENTEMPLRVVCKLVSTGLYCACPPADIVPLIKDDDYGNKNVIPKYNLALSQVFRDYSPLFTLYNIGELCCNWVRTVLKSKQKMIVPFLCPHVVVKTLKFGDFTLLFCEVR